MKINKVFRVFMLVVIISSGSMIFISDERYLWFIIFIWQILAYLFSKQVGDYKEIVDRQNQILKDKTEQINKLSEKISKEGITIK